MWNHSETNFFNLLSESYRQIHGIPFKEVLLKHGLEIETTDINFYTPPFLNQIDVKLGYFLGVSLDTFWLNLDPSLLVKFPTIPVDKSIFNRAVQLFKQYGLDGHAEQLASIMKFGYSLYTLAEEVENLQEMISGIKELKKLADFAFSGKDIFQIHFLGNEKSEKVSIETPLMKQFITNSIANTMLDNIKQGWLNILKIETPTKAELNIRYRNIYIFILVFYLYREAGFIKLGKGGKVSITKDAGSLIVDILEVTNVKLKISQKWANDSREPATDEALVNSCLRRALEVNPELERFLYEGEYSEEEYNEHEEVRYQEIEGLTADLERRFINKLGLRDKN